MFEAHDPALLLLVAGLSFLLLCRHNELRCTNASVVGDLKESHGGLVL